MTIYILRHAEKALGNFYNEHLRHQDEPISPRGEEQARKLWSYFCDKQISAIYISEYQRTRQTIDFVAEQSGVAPAIDVRLNEIDNGEFDRLSEVEIQRQYPQVWSAYRARNTDFRFPGGETGAEVRARIANFLEEQRVMHGDQNIIVVCHEGWIRSCACYLLDLPVYKRWNFYVDFCGITEITYQQEYGEWKLVRFNQIIR